MNKQQIFDTVVKGILSQGGESFNSGTGYCAYRNGQGRKCAIGWLIPDEIYTSNMEYAYSVDDITNKIGIDAEHDAFCFELQMIHDSSGRAGLGNHRKSDEDFLSEWKKRMIDFAEREGLSIEVFATDRLA